MDTPCFFGKFVELLYRDFEKKAIVAQKGGDIYNFTIESIESIKYL
jgi:hypothetical protein